MKIPTHLAIYTVNLSASDAIEPSDPTISRTQNGSALTGPVMLGVNQNVSIWCRANNTNMRLIGFNWRYANDTRIPKADSGDHVHVYRESVGNRNSNTFMWWTVLHFRNIQPFYKGVYNCVANYNNHFKNQSLDVQVSGV